MKSEVRYALEQAANGDPLRDFLDDYDILDALLDAQETEDNLLHVMTHTNVKNLMDVFGFDPNDCELGDVMVAVRKLLRKTLNG